MIRKLSSRNQQARFISDIYCYELTLVLYLLSETCMLTRKVLPTILVIILISIGMMGCTMGSGIFTEEELGAMYQIVVSREGTVLDSGARVTTATELGLSVEGIDGAPEADSIEIVLSFPDGTQAASILFATAETNSDDVIVVKDFEDDIPPFAMPEDLPDGYYALLIRIKNATGGILARHSTAVLLYDGVIPTPSLTVYPGFVIAGGVSLIRLEADYPAAIDPWIRWTVDGKVLLAGFNSDFADRLAWRAPATSGVYLAKAEIYPFMPPSGFEIAPLTSAEIRLPLSSTAQQEDPLAPLGAWSRLTFDGDLIEKGSRAHAEEPTVLGTPILETYASGFGYLLGNGAGVASTSSLLPVHEQTNSLASFTALFVLAQASTEATPGSGTLLTVPAGNGFPGLVIGVEKGVPYFKSGNSTVPSVMELPTSASRLAVYVAPADNGAFIQFYVDEQPAGSGTIVSPLFQFQPGSCIVSGPDGYIAIFDELRIMEGAYPAFLLSEQAAKGKSLISASGFEGGILGPGFATVGDAIKLTHGSLSLGSDSRLIIGSSGIPTQGTSLTFNHIEGKAIATIRLADGNSLGVDTDGTIWLGGEATGFNVGGDTNSSLTVAIEPTEAGIIVYSSDDSWVLFDDSAPALDATWNLTSIGDKNAVVSKVSLSVLKSTLASTRRLRMLSADSRQMAPFAAALEIQREAAGPVPASQALANLNQ